MQCSRAMPLAAVHHIHVKLAFSLARVAVCPLPDGGDWPLAELRLRLRDEAILARPRHSVPTDLLGQSMGVVPVRQNHPQGVVEKGPEVRLRAPDSFAAPAAGELAGSTLRIGHVPVSPILHGCISVCVYAVACACVPCVYERR